MAVSEKNLQPNLIGKENVGRIQNCMTEGMKMRTVRNLLIVLAILLALGLGGVCGGYHWYRTNHVKIGETVYDRSVELVDLRGQEISIQEYEMYCKTLPRARVLWDVPFQGTSYPNDTQEIRITSLTREDIDALKYLPELTHVDAMDCRDYTMLETLKAERPECQVDYQLHLGEKVYDQTVTSLNFSGDSVGSQELQAVLPYMEALQTVTFEEPSIPAADLYAMQEAYPNVTFTWTKSFLGKPYGMDTEMIDISNTKPGDLKLVEDTMAYFPNLKQLDILECGYEFEDLAAYRDRVRDKYKVVWGVPVGQAYLRTDETKFIPSNENKRVRDDDTYNLRYCEDLIAVDLGHLNISNLEWVVGTPHLKYLIMGDANIYDENLKPISCLKELEWLELFHTPLKDVSPLVGCTALKDLLLSQSYIDVKPLGQMPWLENIWLLRSGVDGEDIAYLHEKLPNTHIEVGTTRDAHSRGWRDLPRYFEMRDALGMWYMKG